MAQNLRKNLPSSDNLIIHDVNSEGTARFAKENSNVQIAEDVRDVAEKAVSYPYPFSISNLADFHCILSNLTLLKSKHEKLTRQTRKQSSQHSQDPPTSKTSSNQSSAHQPFSATA